MDAKLTTFFVMLMFYWTAVITYLISRKMQDRKRKKSSLYPEFLKKRTNSLLCLGEKIKNKELIPWYSQNLNAMEKKLKSIEYLYKNTSVSEEKAAYKVVLLQEAKEMLELCKKLKKEYGSVLLRKDKKHLDTQINFANTILLES